MCAAQSQVTQLNILWQTALKGNKPISRSSHRIQTQGGKSKVWWNMHFLSLGPVRTTGLSSAEAGSGLPFPKGERGLPRKLQPPTHRGKMSLKGCNSQLRARCLNCNCQDGKCIKSHQLHWSGGSVRGRADSLCGLYHLRGRAVEQRKLSRCHLLKLHSALSSLPLETLTDHWCCSHLTSGETTAQRLSGNFKVK